VSRAATASSRFSRGKPQLTQRRILRIAETAAERAGDPKPTLIEHSEGARQNANLVDSGDMVLGRQWSYLIAERGHFVFNDAPRPAGARAPSGSVLTLIVDASRGQITDAGLSNRYPHLAQLGPVHTDLRLAPEGAEASCVGLTRPEQRGAAKVIAVGRMLPVGRQRSTLAKCCSLRRGCG
jgi:hypothetical protein